MWKMLTSEKQQRWTLKIVDGLIFYLILLQEGHEEFSFFIFPQSIKDFHRKKRSKSEDLSQKFEEFLRIFHTGKIVNIFWWGWLRGKSKVRMKILKFLSFSNALKQPTVCPDQWPRMNTNFQFALIFPNKRRKFPCKASCHLHVAAVVWEECWKMSIDHIKKRISFHFPPSSSVSFVVLAQSIWP